MRSYSIMITMFALVNAESEEEARALAEDAFPQDCLYDEFRVGDIDYEFGHSYPHEGDNIILEEE